MPQVTSTPWQGNLAFLKDFARRARAKEPLKVVALGGSVTNGGACESYALGQSKRGDFGACAWTNRLVLSLQRHFRNPRISLRSLAQPATTSPWIVSHFDAVLQQTPDLLLVDYAINDPNFDDSADGRAKYGAMMRSATEALIRRFFEFNERHNRTGDF